MNRVGNRTHHARGVTGSAVLPITSSGKLVFPPTGPAFIRLNLFDQYESDGCTYPESAPDGAPSIPFIQYSISLPFRRSKNLKKYVRAMNPPQPPNVRKARQFRLPFIKRAQIADRIVQLRPVSTTRRYQ